VLSTSNNLSHAHTDGMGLEHRPRTSYLLHATAFPSTEINMLLKNWLFLSHPFQFIINQHKEVQSAFDMGSTVNKAA
jgi:hypothetical protein